MALLQGFLADGGDPSRWRQLEAAARAFRSPHEPTAALTAASPVPVDRRCVVGAGRAPAVALLFLAPTVLIVGALVAYPILHTI